MKRRRYTIQPSDCVNFVTGVSRHGEQVILGIPGPCVLAVFFDNHGEFSRSETRVLPEAASAGVGRLADETIAQLWSLLANWKSELALKEATISIFSFRIPNSDVRVSDLPDYLQKISDDPGFATPGDLRAEYGQEIEDWRRDGRFVLRWGNEYWLDSSGSVIAT